MFGDPVQVDKDDAVFYLVWTYGVKTLDGRKKARCVCNGSSRSGLVTILDKTYTNCVDQTSSRLFSAISAGENLLVFSADVSNAFAEAPPPKTGLLCPSRQSISRLVGPTQTPPPDPGGPCYPCFVGHARPSRIAPLMGKAR
jgi:hypothetical protein